MANLADRLRKGPAGNLYLGTPQETFLVRGIANAMYDFQMEAKTWEGASGADAKFLTERAPLWFTQMQRVLDKNDDGDTRTEEFCIGKNFTFADVAMFDALNGFINVHGLSKLRNWAKLKEFHDKVSSSS